METFPEIDRAAWFELPTARKKFLRASCLFSIALKDSPRRRVSFFGAVQQLLLSARRQGFRRDILGCRQRQSERLVVLLQNRLARPDGSQHPAPFGLAQSTISSINTGSWPQFYTGQRRSDVIRMTWRDISAGSIQVTQMKTGARLRIKLHPKLCAALDGARELGSCS